MFSAFRSESKIHRFKCSNWRDLKQQTIAKAQFKQVIKKFIVNEIPETKKKYFKELDNQQILHFLVFKK